MVPTEERNHSGALLRYKEENILERYSEKRKVGGYGQKPFFSSMPEKIMKKTIRNMLPFKHGRGKDAFARIKCYSGIPKEFEGKKLIKAGRGKKGINLEKIAKMFQGR